MNIFKAAWHFFFPKSPALRSHLQDISSHYPIKISQFGPGCFGWKPDELVMGIRATFHTHGVRKVAHVSGLEIFLNLECGGLVQFSYGDQRLSILRIVFKIKQTKKKVAISQILRYKYLLKKICEQ